MENLKKVMLEKTNQIFEQTLKRGEYTQKLTWLNTYFSWIEFMDKKRHSQDGVINLLYEATFDLVSSLFNSFSGFYRQGMISLRSSLELTGLYVYYFDHPIEFAYFTKEGGTKGPLLSELINEGDFLVKKYCSLFIDKEKLKKELHTEVKNTYKKLSLYVHGRLGKLQTLIAFPISFNENQMSKFIEEWEKVIGLGNTVLGVRFWNKINEMEKEKREQIRSIIKNLNILEV